MSPSDNRATTLTVDQVSDLLSLSTATIRRHITAGTFDFPARKIGQTYVIPARPILDFLGIEPEAQVSA